MKLIKVKTLTKGLNIVPSTDMYERTLRDTLEAQKNSAKQPLVGYRPNMWRILVGSRTGALMVGCLTISLSMVCFVLYRHTADLKHELAQARRDNALSPADDSATINFYLKEHLDLAAQHASASPAAPQSAQMRVNKHDILYYESFDDGPEYMSPGIIVRGPSSQQQISLQETPTIANGHTLTLSEARKASNFDLVAPPRLYPGLRLDKIMRIEDRDALHLLYTDGINPISLFEQPLDGQRGLEPKDFREYAVYRNKEQAGGTILAWRDNARSYVLIGSTEFSQLMNMAQSISATK